MRRVLLWKREFAWFWETSIEKSSENSLALALDLPLFGVMALNRSAVMDLSGLALMGETIDNKF